MPRALNHHVVYAGWVKVRLPVPHHLPTNVAKSAEKVSSINVKRYGNLALREGSRSQLLRLRVESLSSIDSGTEQARRPLAANLRYRSSKASDANLRRGINQKAAIHLIKTIELSFCRCFCFAASKPGHPLLQRRLTIGAHQIALRYSA